MTPLIDIIFQLVLFFMVTTTFQQSPAIDIQLPESATDQRVSQERSAEIWIDSNGALSIDAKVVTQEELRSIVSDKVAQQKGITVV